MYLELVVQQYMDFPTIKGKAHQVGYYPEFINSLILLNLVVRFRLG